MTRLVTFAALLLSTSQSFADVLSDIASLKKSPDRASWDRLVEASPDALLLILKAWPENDPVTGNWLRTAFDQIAARAGDKAPVDELLAFAQDSKAFGRARRVALATVERVRPGTTATLLGGWLNDPEFGADAVEAIAAAAEKLPEAEARVSLSRAYSTCTDLEQAVLLAKKLTSLGVKPDLLAHLGVVRSWNLIGPFPVSPEEGLSQAFPPETKIDLAAEYNGKAGKLKWAAATSDDADGRLDVVKFGIRPDDGAVCYAMATVNLAVKTAAEVRVSAVDNVTVWVNGTKVVERASEYRSMFRPDRYRSTVQLPAGESVVLVKSTKTRAEEVRGKPSSPAKWDLLVRFVGSDGRAIPFTQPEVKK